jgi:O-antigen/teichoic acid export membrane protein
MKIFKNSIYQYLSTIYIGIISFTLNIFLARYLGPEEYGLYNLIIITSAFFLIFFEAGMRNFIIKENLLSTENDNKDLLSYSLSNGLLILIILVFIFYFFNIEKEYIFGLVCFFLISQQQLVSFYLKGKKMFYEDSIWQSQVRSLSFIGIIFIFFFSTKDLRITNIFLIWSISILVLIYIIQKKINFNYSFKLNYKIYKYTFFFLLIDIVVFINFKSDIYLLKLFNFDNYSLGLYSATFKFVEMTAMLISPLVIVIFPLFRENLKKIKIFKKNLFKFIIFFLFLSFVFFGFFYLFESFLINLFYGNLYYESYKYLKVFKYLIFLLPLTGFVTYVLISIDLKKEYFLIILFSLIVKILFSLKYYEIFKEFSIIYGSIISEMLIFIMSLITIYFKMNNEKKNSY